MTTQLELKGHLYYNDISEFKFPAGNNCLSFVILNKGGWISTHIISCKMELNEHVTNHFMGTYFHITFKIPVDIMYLKKQSYVKSKRMI